LDELCAVTGRHRKHAVRALAAQAKAPLVTPGQRKPTYGAAIKDALVALWEASDRICGKRLKVMIPTLLPSLERHGRLTLDQFERALVLSVSAATIDRQLVATKIAAAGGKRRRVGILLDGAARGSDPNVQRLERSGSGVLRGRHGSARRHVGGWFVYPDVDDDGRRHWLDRMHAAPDAREWPRRAGDGVCTESIPLDCAWRRLRQ
jgi:hypothetical protein